MTNQLRWEILGTSWIANMFVKDLQLTGHQVSSVGSRKHEEVWGVMLQPAENE